MNWPLLDHALWQTLLTLLAILVAYKIGQRQIRIQDTIELYCSLLTFKVQNENSDIVAEVPCVHVQNVGTRLIYLDKYIFNGREYFADSQILPSTYSQTENNFYRIELPVNGEGYVSIEVFYHDLDNRPWHSKIIATKTGLLGWDIKTLPRKRVV